jgi:hypothetical protein
MKLRGHKLATAPAVSLALALGVLGSPGNPADAAVRHRAPSRVAVFPRLTPSRAASPALPPKAQPLDPPWSQQDVPSVRFQHGRRAAVSCLSRTYCITVGSTIAYGEPNPNPAPETSSASIWNGSVWSPMPMPSVSGAVSSYLSGVSCIPGYRYYCAAVGAYTTSSGTQPLTEIWNGFYWRVTTSPTLQGSAKSALTAVSCTATGFCMAVGVAQGPGGEFLLDEDENYGPWRAIPGPLLFLHTPDLVVSGVSCSGSSQCMAVGGDYSSSGEEVSLAALWQGHDWFRVPTPTPGQSGGLRGVSCPAPSRCTAVGYYSNTPGAFAPQRTLAERWDGGRSWTVMTTANDGKGTDGLYAISCRQVNACAAVGEYVDSTGIQQTLAEQLAGPSWAVKPTADLAGSLDNQLNGVSCTKAGTCTAVGDYQDQTAAFTQGWAWNGTAWHPERNARDQAALYAESCSAASACTAVGYWTPFDSAQSLSFVLAERWNGVTWSVQLAPSPGSTEAVLGGVSCPTATFCLAVGYDYDGFTGAYQNWAEEWNGTSWTWQSPPGPGNTGTSLNAVSCVTPAWCAAVGEDTPGTDVQDLADVWQSGGWAAQNVPSPSSLSALLGVSCTAVMACTAVGDQETSDGQYGIALGLSGTAWSVEGTASPVNSRLLSVSCTTSACTAVGVSSAGSQLTQQYPLAEQLTDGTWTMQTTPNPGGTFTSLVSVSCTAADACTAVGAQSPAGSAGNATLAETWNGSVWAVQSTVSQAGAAGSQLDAVSCVASACNAAGYYNNAEQDDYPLAESEAPGS